jgi:hypothetical protein
MGCDDQGAPMTIPVRIQLSRRKGWRMPPNTVKVDRTSKWGNLFIVGTDGTRAECVNLFRIMMSGSIALIRCPELPDAQIAYMKMARRDRDQLRGKNLACWCTLCPRHAAGRPFNEPCADCAPCYVDVLLEVANA